MNGLRIVLSFVLIATAVALNAAGTSSVPTKDSVSINQEDFQLFGIPESNVSKKTALLIVKIYAKVSLASQEKAYLRAAMNLDAPESFRSVFAKELGRGNREEEIELKFPNPKQKTLRVIVWLDKEGTTAPPRPLASDNIAFDITRFLNANDR